MPCVKDAPLDTESRRGPNGHCPSAPNGPRSDRDRPGRPWRVRPGPTGPKKAGPSWKRAVLETRGNAMRSVAPYGVLGLVSIMSACAIAGADAATVSGTVRGPDGAPFRGAFVQARHAG